jgi:hypothetical protein
VTIPSSSSSTTFYYGDTDVGSPTITASGSYTSGTQVETITKASPTVTADERHRGYGHRHHLDQFGPSQRLGIERRRHYHLHGLRSPVQRADHLHLRGHHCWDGHRFRQRHLSPVGELHPDGDRQLLVVCLLRR